ncbi:MAG: hypothetical protein LKF96_01295 [Treponema sp.]|jgi:hypothetical protein|nr:hypothetical protein [Treponema sp.]
MGTYTLKSIGKSTDYMTIVRDMEDGYVVRIVRDRDGYEDITTDYISKALFDSCIRTGYLTKIEEPVKLAVNA